VDNGSGNRERTGIVKFLSSCLTTTQSIPDSILINPHGFFMPADFRLMTTWSGSFINKEPNLNIRT